MTMTTTSTDSTGISYQVGALYPYRGENGERMDYGEAASYLMEVRGMRSSEAYRRLDLLQVEAIRDAPTPHVELVATSPERLYRLEGADAQPRAQVTNRLVAGWRRTHGEAADLLDNAPYRPGNLR